MTTDTQTKTIGDSIEEALNEYRNATPQYRRIIGGLWAAKLFTAEKVWAGMKEIDNHGDE